MKIVFEKFREVNEATHYATMVQDDLIAITFADKWWYVFYKEIR